MGWLKICKELIPSTEYECEHAVDRPSFLVEWKDYGECGIIKAGAEWLGQTSKRDPCENRKWVVARG